MVIATRGLAAPGRQTEESGRTLRSAFDPRRNSLTMLRLILATTVAVVHASAIATGAQPTFRTDPLIGPTTVGDLAVDGFFVVSGFLVTMSYLRLGSPMRYLWHRVVRIMPAFWVCLVVTAIVVAPVLAALEGRAPWSVYPDSLYYVGANAALHMFSFDVAGLPTHTGVPGVVNGALWTLYYEFVCYLGVLVLGITGILTRRRWVVPVLVLLLWGANIVHTTGLMTLPAWQMRRLALLFLLGTCAYLFAEYVRIDMRLVVASLALLAVSLPLLPDYRALAAPAFAYLLLWAMVRLPLTWDPGVDISYGMYIFHWPIQTMLVLAGAAGVLGLVGYTLLAVALAALAAGVSWFLVEKPALARKSMSWPFSWGWRASSERTRPIDTAARR